MKWELIIFRKACSRKYGLKLTDEEYGYLMGNPSYWQFLFEKIAKWCESQGLVVGIDCEINVGGCVVRFENSDDRTAFLMSEIA